VQSIRSPELGGFFRLTQHYSNATRPQPNITFIDIHPDCCRNFAKPMTPSDSRIELNSIRSAVVARSSRIFTHRFVYDPGYEGRSGRLPDTIDISGLPVVDEGIYFLHRFHKCYFHLMAESLPHLLSLETTVLANSLILIIAHPIKSVFRDMLGLYGVPNYRLFFVASFVFVRNLHVTTPWVAGRSYFNPTRAMAEFVIRKLNLIVVTASQKIVIQRKEKGRKIINWDKMCAELDETFGRFHQFHSAPMREQVRLFRNSFLVLAVRGSGIVNVIWMLPKTVLVEIQTHHCNPDFAFIAFQSGMFVVETTRGYIFSNSPIWIDLPMVLRAVRLGLQLYNTTKP
jgi:hypothetical protein